jgi:hypothetical protein
VGVLFFLFADAQYRAAVNAYTIKNGKMYIELSRQIKGSSIDSFMAKYNLYGIGLNGLIQNNDGDSLEKLGWKIEINNKYIIGISKRLIGADHIVTPEDRITFMEKHPTMAELFPVVNNGVRYGYNRFRNKFPFVVKNLTVTFFLRNHIHAGKVLLAGSFTGWQENALSMKVTDSGWIVQVKLDPGKYWYKFIIDGNWQIDTDNRLSENDGLGNTNSVFYQPNVLFTLDQYSQTRRVYLAGSFNDWRPDELEMTKTAKGWQLPLYLADGTHTYRFVVGGQWMADPANPEKFPNEYNDYNSVIRIGKPYLFQLAGYTNAGKVILTGSFNNWRNNELPMNKTATGWQLPYTLGGGNYEYGFIIDNKLVTDPTNPLTVKNHSYLVVAPNFTFRLKKHADAKTVYLSGDFDEWSPNTLVMKKEGNDWVFSVHLSVGKHLYKFIVDGKWIIDPTNPLWEQNEYGNGNSIVWVEK